MLRTPLPLRCFTLKNTCMCGCLLLLATTIFVNDFACALQECFCFCGSAAQQSCTAQYMYYYWEGSKNQNSTSSTWCMTRRRSSRGRAAASWATSSTHSPSSPVSPLSSSCPHHRGKHPSHLGWLLILHPRLLKFDSFLYDVIHWDGWRCCVPLQLKNASAKSEDKKKRKRRSWECHLCIIDNITSAASGTTTAKYSM